MPRYRTPWPPPDNPNDTLHAWTDGYFRNSFGMGWIMITRDSAGTDDALAQHRKSLRSMQTAFDAEISAIEEALDWLLQNDRDYRALTIHSDSTRAISRAGQTSAGPGPEYGIRIQRWLSHLGKLSRKRMVNIEWVKRHAGAPGNERPTNSLG
jgi:ribonuclease HI